MDSEWRKEVCFLTPQAVLLVVKTGLESKFEVVGCVTNPPGGDNASGKILYAQPKEHTEGERFVSVGLGHKDF